MSRAGAEPGPAGIRVEGSSGEGWWLRARPRPGSSGAIGRERELDELASILASRTARVVTVTGQAGVGKTTLVTAVLDRLEPERVIVADVSGLGDAGTLGDAVVGAYPHEHGLSRGAEDLLWDQFGGAPVLLVVDGADPLGPVGAEVARLVDAYPELRVVCTSITPLRVAGEHVLRLAPLPTSDDPTDDPGVELFLARARAASVGFEPGPDDLPAIHELVRECGGLPLAIELAAVRARTIPPALMAQQLAAASAAELLRVEASGAPARHHSVDAALQWTVERLTPGAREVLEHAGVFRGWVDLGALGAVLPEALPMAELLDRVTELVEVHLMELVRGDDADALVRLTPLVRSVALGRLRARGDEDRARVAHADYFTAVCRTDPQVVRRSWPDVLAALDHRLLTGRSDEVLRAAVQAAGELTDQPGAEEALLPRLDALLADDTGADAGTRSRALLWSMSHTTLDAQDLATHAAWTTQRLAEATRLALVSGDHRALLAAYEMTIRSVSVTLDLAGAMAAAADGLRLAQRLGDDAALGRFEVYAAMAAGSAGEADRCATLARSALERGIAADDVATVAYAAVLLRMLATRTGGPVPETPALVVLLRRCEEAEQPFAALHVLTAMTQEAIEADDLVTASSLLARQLSLVLDHGRSMPFGGISALVLVVRVGVDRGSPQDALGVGTGLEALGPLVPSVAPLLHPTLVDCLTRVRAQVPPEAQEEIVAVARSRSLRATMEHALGLTRAWAHDRAPRPPAAATAVGLTARQLEVLVEMARGGTNKEIAERLGVTAKTVMHHAAAIYQRLGVRGRTEAAAWAYRHGLVAHAAPDEDRADAPA